MISLAPRLAPPVTLTGGGRVRRPDWPRGKRHAQKGRASRERGGPRRRSRENEFDEQFGLSLVCGRVRSLLCEEFLGVETVLFMVRAFVCENQKGGSRLEVRVRGSRFMVQGSWFEAGSFDIVSELALRLQVHECRGDARRQDTRQPTEPREVSVLFLFHLGFWGVCVCVRPRPSK